ALVVVADAAFRRTIVRVAFEPGVEAGLLRRLPRAGRATLQLGDLAGDSPQVFGLIDNSGARQEHIAYRAGNAFAEPQGAGIHLVLIVDGLERLRTDTLDVPQVKELVGTDPRERQQAVTQAVGIDVNGGTVGVLHATGAIAAGKMVEEGVFLVR